MARLFIGPREMNFISDIAKEVIKDINGQMIKYYPISGIKTQAHDIYNEAIKKIFDNPIEIDAFVDAQIQEPSVINKFGVDARYKVDVFVQYRDLVDKGIDVAIGDFFSFSDVFYEITSTRVLKNIFGQAEHKNGVVISGTKARKDQFDAPLIGPTDIKYTDDDAVQTTFVQQRGYKENKLGKTGDKRETQTPLGKPITGPKEVSPRGSAADNSNYESSFYSDGDD